MLGGITCRYEIRVHNAEADLTIATAVEQSTQLDRSLAPCDHQCTVSSDIHLNQGLGIQHHLTPYLGESERESEQEI